MAIRYSAFLLAIPLLGQTIASPPAFEAASLKPNTSRGAYYYKESPGRLEIQNVPLKILIYMAYSAHDYAFSGPGWLDSVILDLVAKFPTGTSRADQNLMMQSLLAERFKLQVHQEAKDVHGYALVIASGGPKIRPGDAIKSIQRLGRGIIVGRSVPITQLVLSLQAYLKAPVQDMTGLSGNYEMNLRWTPDEPVPGENGAVALDDRGPSIFTAMQEQLGLKLESRKVPTTMVFVDHVERAPIDN